MEETVLESVQTFPAIGAVNVCWKQRIVLDGERVVDTGTLRRAYMAAERDQFIADVENPERGGKAGDATPYLEALGWT